MAGLSKVGKSGSLLVAVLAVSIICMAEKAGAPKPGIRVSAVKLTAPLAITGKPCPVTVNFVGSITASGPLVVQYTWASSDGRAWPQQTLTFTQSAALQVTQSVPVPATGKGWLQLKVLAPNALNSTQAVYSVTCSTT